MIYNRFVGGDFLKKVSLHSPGYSGTHYVNQVDLEVRNPLVPVPQESSALALPEVQRQ